MRKRSAQLLELTYQGIKLLIDGPQGEVKEGFGVDGKPYRVVRTVPYGFVAPMDHEGKSLMIKGDDAEDFDGYVGPDATAARVRIATQLHPRNGHHNELKAIFGCASDDEAKSILSTHVAPRMVGRIGSLTVDAFKEQLAAYVASPGASKVPFRPETDEDVDELTAVQAIAIAEGMGDAMKSVYFHAGPESAATRFIPGERVKVAGTPHMPGQTTGVIATAQVTDVYSIVFDGMDMVHKWYIGDELTAEEAEKTHQVVTRAATNFPDSGSVRALNLRSSRFARFDREVATKLETAYPETWSKGGPAKRDVFAVLCRAAATGGGCRTRAEIAALRLREAWASKHAAETSLSSVVGAVKYLVVLAMGEDAMKAMLTKDTDDGDGVVSSDEPSSEQPSTDSGEVSSDGDSIEETAGADGQKAKRRRLRTMPAAVIPPLDHRSEDPGDTGPLSLRSPPRPVMPETITHESFTALVRNCAALGVAAGNLSQRSSAALLGFLARSPDAGVPQRSATGPGAPATGGAPARRSNAPPVALTADFDRPDRQLALEIDRKSLDEEKREVWFCASSAAVDSYGEVVDQSEWNFTRWDANPVILWAHCSYEFPIGKGIERKVEGGKLWIKVRFSKKNPVGVLAWDLVVEDMLRAVSVGFRSAEMLDEIIDGVRRTILKKNSLYELSLCSIPANPEALIDVKRFASLEARLVRDLGATFQRAGVTPDLTHLRHVGDASLHAALGEQLAALTAAIANLKSAGPPALITTPAIESPPAVTPAATTTSRTAGDTSMKLRSLASFAALLPVLRDSGELTLAAEDGTPVQLAAPSLKAFVVEVEAKVAKLEGDLAAEKTAAGVALEKQKAAEDKAKTLLDALTKSELEPLVGIDLHCLSPADRDDLALVRSANEDLYARQLASVKARYAKGVEALKAAGGTTGATTTTTTAEVLPTKAKDAAALTTGETVVALAAGVDPLTASITAMAEKSMAAAATNR